MSDSAARIHFLGAAGSVTGSRFLIEYASSQLLLEAGLFQGPRELRRRNWDDLPMPAAEIDAVAISHAHLDHCGYLPRLWRQGYRGPIYLTPDTANLAAIILRDSAHLQEEDAKYARKKGYSRHENPEPLYTSQDAEGAISLFRPVNFWCVAGPAGWGSPSVSSRRTYPGGGSGRSRSSRCAPSALWRPWAGRTSASRGTPHNPGGGIRRGHGGVHLWRPGSSHSK